MKKVICTRDDVKNPGMTKPIVGEYYDVEQDPNPEYWLIASLPFHPSGEAGRYHKRYFAELSEIDETARLEAWQAERLTHADKMLKALAENLPEVKMPQENFERVWNNVKKTL